MWIAKRGQWDTYDDNLDCDECDNDELHASARCLRKLGVMHTLADRAEGRKHTSCRSCRSTDCTSAAYVILSLTARVRVLTSNAALKELKYPVPTNPSLASGKEETTGSTFLLVLADPSRSLESRRSFPCLGSGPGGSAATRRVS